MSKLDPFSLLFFIFHHPRRAVSLYSSFLRSPSSPFQEERSGERREGRGNGGHKGSRLSRGSLLNRRRLIYRCYVSAFSLEREIRASSVRGEIDGEKGCPFASEENDLKLAVEAGEKRFR